MQKDILTYEQLIIEIERLNERLNEAEEELLAVQNNSADQLKASESEDISFKSVAMIEAELATYREHLEELVIERTKELTETNQALQEEIIERTRAEEALKETEENLHLFIKHTPAALALFDKNMHYLAVSKRWLTDYGIIDEDIIGRSHYEVFPEISDEWKSMHSRCLAGATEHAEEDQFFRADGSVQWLRWEVRPWEISDGVIGGILIFSEDITERKLSENLLKKYQMLSENTHEIILFMNRDGSIIEANSAAISAYQYTKDELLNLSIFDLRSPESVNLTESQMAEAVSKGILFESRHRRKDGSDFDVEVSSQGKEIGGQIIVLSVIRDITEQKENEQALWESTDKFELLAESANMLLVSDNPEKVINELCKKIMEHLDCEVFLYYLVDEEKGSLHLKAYAGISEDLGKKIEWLDYGESVSGCVILDAQSFKAEDVLGISESKLDLGKSFDFQAYACNPLLTSDGAVIGTLSFASKFKNSFSQDDLVLMEIVTNQIAAAIERTRLFNAAEEGRLILAALMEYVPEGLIIAEAPNVKMVMGSKYALELNGRPLENFQGITVDEHASKCGVYCLDGVTPAENKDLPLTRATEKGEIVNNDEWIMRRSDGTDITILCNAGPIRDKNGEITGGVIAFRDISRRKLEEAELAKAKAEAEKRAAELQVLLDAVPAAVWISHDPECKKVTGNRLAHKLTKYPPGIKTPKSVEENGKLSLHKMFKNGREMLPEEMPVQMAAKGVKIRDFEFDFVYTDGRVRHMFGNASPIFDAEGNPQGSISVFMDWTDRAEFEKRQQELLEREYHISEILQQALLPPQVPNNLYGLSIATRYKPALKEAQVGGDFYDIFELDNNKVGVLIGDVAGKGLQAAIRVSAARHTIRSYAFLDPSPGSVLSLANEALIRENADVENLLTAFFAVLDISNGTMIYANAGHEPPVICGLVSGVKELDVTGAMLGIIPGSSYSECICNLIEGDKVVMFTDGITEARRDGSILFEKEGVIKHLEKHCDDLPDDIADSLLNAATAHAGGILQDDVAIVVVGYSIDN